MKNLIKIIIAVVVLSTSVTLSSSAQNVRYNGKFESNGSFSVKKNTSAGFFGLRTVHGVELGRTVFIGLGTGLEYAYVPKNILVPVFLQTDYTFSKSAKFKPYLSLRMGHIFTGEHGHGLDVNPSFGLKFSRIGLSVGYRHLFINEEVHNYSGYGPSTVNVLSDLGCLSFGMTVSIF